jgi:hypothetical protein
LRSDREVLALADKLHAYSLAHPTEPRFTRVRITLTGGRVLEGVTTDYRGSENMPFSDELMEKKFRSLAGVLLPEERLGRIVETVAGLEALPSMRELVPLLVAN